MLLRWIEYIHLFNYRRRSYIAKVEDLPINNQIKAEQVMVIGPNGEKLGIKKLEDALTLANYAGLDLVLMNQSFIL